jgi:hypothetical protein
VPSTTGRQRGAAYSLADFGRIVDARQNFSHLAHFKKL